MKEKRFQPTNKTLLWIEMHRNNINLALKMIGLTLALLLMVQNIIGLATFGAFINEEALQKGEFTWGTPMMSKEFELALAVLKKEEKHYRYTAQAIIDCWDPKALLNPITLYKNLRMSFVGYARTSLRKIEHDKSFLTYMVKKEAHAKYIAKLGRKAYR